MKNFLDRFLFLFSALAVTMYSITLKNNNWMNRSRGGNFKLNIIRMAMVPTKLSIDEVKNELKNLQGWSLKETPTRNEITKSFVFKDFIECFGYMTKIALISEKLEHHPEWFNVYNRLTVTLSTHDCGGLSEKDFNLAKQIELELQKSK